MQRSLGKETICAHLPPALCGAPPEPPGADAALQSAPPAGALPALPDGGAAVPTNPTAAVAAAGDGAAAPGQAAIGVKRERSPEHADGAVPLAGAQGVADEGVDDGVGEGSRRSRRKPARSRRTDESM